MTKFQRNVKKVLQKKGFPKGQYLSIFYLLK